jgi:hypothetical protein
MYATHRKGAKNAKKGEWIRGEKQTPRADSGDNGCSKSLTFHGVNSLSIFFASFAPLR